MKKIFIFFAISFSSLAAVAGGGWPLAKGSAYYKLGQNWIVSSAYYGPSGEIVNIRTTSLFTTSLYAEYGISDRFTLITYLPFFVRTTLNEVHYQQSGKIDAGEFLNSFGDTDISLKYGLVMNKPIVVSATLMLGLPLGETSGGASGILQSGDGEFNQMVKFDASHSFYPKPLYTSAYLAFNNRTRNFSDEIRYGLELGYTIKNKLILIGKLNVVESLFNGSDAVADNGIFSNNTEYVSPMLEVGYAFGSSFGISASAGFAFSGKNILASPNFGVGLYLKTAAKK